MLRFLLLFPAFIQTHFNFIHFQLVIVSYALQNNRRRSSRVITMTFLEDEDERFSESFGVYLVQQRLVV